MERPSADTGYPKYLILPNGSRVQFTAPSVPSSGNPAVTCAAAAGTPRQ